MGNLDRRSIKFLAPMFILLVAFAIIGCVNVKTSSYFTPAKTKLSGFEAIQFEAFQTDINYFPKEALTRIPAEAAALMAPNKNFKVVKYGEVENVPADHTIVVLGEVAGYRPSSDITYEDGGVKLGEVAIAIKLAIVNKATGEEISAGEISGFSPTGFIAKDIYGTLAREIVRHIEDN